MDSDAARAESAASHFEIPRWMDDLNAMAGLIDHAIVATPPSSHCPIATDLLEQGINVLVEKPMATTPQECEQMIQSAKRGGSVLTVGVMRKFWYATRWLKGFLDSGFGRDVQSFHIREGFRFRWPAVSDYFIRRQAAGGGVLIDTGSHTLDLMLSWFGEVADVEYRDDNYGGVEADCEIRLTMKTGAKGIVELSRARDLQDYLMIRGSDWLIQAPEAYRNVLSAQPRSILRGKFANVRGDRLPVQTLPDLYIAQIDNWLGLPGRDYVDVSAEQGLATVKVICDCYRARRSLDLPWVAYETARLPVQG